MERTTPLENLSGDREAAAWIERAADLKVLRGISAASDVDGDPAPVGEGEAAAHPTPPPSH